jgi:predicted ATP-grasp superfamily ATP-dependent carboligase
MSDPKPFVGVVGASARAAVHSLARAGYPAWAVDLFTDRDLFAPSARCPLDDYPRVLSALADQFFPGPVLYTGGLENHPDVVAMLSAHRPLWGNTPAVLERVRDPLFPGDVWESAEGDGVRVPHVLVEGECPDPDFGRWLRKPRRGAGGDGITELYRGISRSVPGDGAQYLQEYVPGRRRSAVFVAGKTTELLGVTEQFVGEPWLHATRFAWCGNVGPVEQPAPTTHALIRYGAALSSAGGLVGLFGVDFQLDHAGVAWPVELNPRYPASAEVIEHATGRALMLDHAAAFGGAWGELPIRRDPRHRVVGKAVYYAPHRIRFPADGPWDDWDRPFDPWNLPAFADVPARGSIIEPGWPVLTMLEGGSSHAVIRARLQSRAADLDRLFAAEHAP